MARFGVIELLQRKTQHYVKSAILLVSSKFPMHRVYGELHFKRSVHKGCDNHIVYHLVGNKNDYELTYHCYLYTIKFGVLGSRSYFKLIHPLNTISFTYESVIICGNVERYRNVSAPISLQPSMWDLMYSRIKMPIELFLAHINEPIVDISEGRRSISDL